ELVHDQIRPGHLAPEVVVLLHGVQLVGGPMEHEAAAQVATVGTEEDDVEALDPALLLQAPQQPDYVVERLDRLLLATSYRIPQTNEQHPVSHFNLLNGAAPSPRLSGRSSRRRRGRVNPPNNLSSHVRSRSRARAPRPD